MIDRSSRYEEVLREKMEQQAFSVQERRSTQQSSRHERYQTVSWDISHSPYERGDEPSRHLSTGVIKGDVEEKRLKTDNNTHLTRSP